MPKKSAVHLKKVDEAVRILGTTTVLKLRQAMILAGFPKKDISNNSVHRMIYRHLEALGVKQRRHLAPTVEVQMMTTNDSVISPLTGGDSDTPTASTTTETAGPTHPKPKRKQSSLGTNMPMSPR